MDDLVWIKRGLLKPGKTQRGLAAAMGIDATGVNRMMAGKRSIKAHELPLIRRYLEEEAPAVDIHSNANTEELVATKNHQGVSLLPGTRPTGARDLPIRGYTKAGEAGQFLDQGQTQGWAMRPDSLRGIAEAYAVRVHDDCMVPRYKPGTVLLVDPFRRPDPGDNVVIQLTSGACFVKELVRRGGGKLVCQQFSPNKTVEWKLDKVKSVHLVVGVDYLER